MLYRLSHQEALDELMVNFNIIATGAVLTELKVLFQLTYMVSLPQMILFSVWKWLYGYIMMLFLYFHLTPSLKTMR